VILTQTSLEVVVHIHNKRSTHGLAIPWIESGASGLLLSETEKTAVLIDSVIIEFLQLILQVPLIGIPIQIDKTAKDKGMSTLELVGDHMIADFKSMEKF
jgi:hypothetical protein